MPSGQCHKAVVLLTFQFGQIEAIDVQIAGAVLLESARFTRVLLLFLGQPVAVVSHQQAVQTGAAQVWQHLLGRFQQIVQ